MTEPQEPTPAPSEAAITAAINERRFDGTPPMFPGIPSEQMTRSLIRNKFAAAYAVDFPVGAVGDAQAPDAVTKAAWALLNALDRCKPTLDGYAVMAHVHGQKQYTGPTFGVEWEALRTALLENNERAAKRGHDGDPPKSRSQLKRIAAQRGEPMPTFEDGDHGPDALSSLKPPPFPPVPASPDHTALARLVGDMRAVVSFYPALTYTDRCAAWLAERLPTVGWTHSDGSLEVLMREGVRLATAGMEAERDGLVAALRRIVERVELAHSEGNVWYVREVELDAARAALASRDTGERT